MVFMWRYRQSTGELFDESGRLCGVGHSGAGVYRNRPDCEHIVSYGPVPRGRYRIGESYDSSHSGPVTMQININGGRARGRGGFLISGDENPAIGGCIVLEEQVRVLIDLSNDKDLEVVR